jgi:hypothetical protein
MTSILDEISVIIDGLTEEISSITNESNNGIDELVEAMACLKVYWLAARIDYLVENEVWVEVVGLLNCYRKGRKRYKFFTIFYVIHQLEL